MYFEITLLETFHATTHKIFHGEGWKKVRERKLERENTRERSIERVKDGGLGGKTFRERVKKRRLGQKR